MDERRELLRTPGSLASEIVVEVLRKYATDRPITSLTPSDFSDRLSAEQIAVFKSLVSAPGGLVNPNWDLYEHQTEMLRQSLAGHPSVITSGTGSGKTESFLMPILAELVREATGWSPVSSPDVPDWRGYKPGPGGALFGRARNRRELRGRDGTARPCSSSTDHLPDERPRGGSAHATAFRPRRPWGPRRLRCRARRTSLLFRSVYREHAHRRSPSETRRRVGIFQTRCTEAPS